MSEQNLLSNPCNTDNQKKDLLLDLKKYKKELKWVALLLLLQVVALMCVSDTARIILAVFSSITLGVLIRKLLSCIKVYLDLNEIKYNEMVGLLKSIEQVKQSNPGNHNQRYKSEDLLGSEALNFYANEEEAKSKGGWTFGEPIGQQGSQQLYDWIETAEGRFRFWGLVSSEVKFKAQRNHLFLANAKYVLEPSKTEKV